MFLIDFRAWLLINKKLLNYCMAEVEINLNVPLNAMFATRGLDKSPSAEIAHEIAIEPYTNGLSLDHFTIPPGRGGY